MTSIINKTVLVTLLCLILVGQSMASVTMFYSMAGMTSMSGVILSDDSSTNSASNSMAHCQHGASASEVMQPMMSVNSAHHESPQQISAKKQPSNSNEQCCAQDCQCLTGGCSNASAFSKSIAYSGINATANKISFVNKTPVTQPLPSLYRPPIVS
ncbi:hypothetical protein [Colwellia asteriadis]